MKENSSVESITEYINAYINTKIELVKLQAADRISAVLAYLISKVIISILILFFILFGSFWAALYISHYMDNTYIGFAIVAIFYGLIGGLLFVFRKRFLINPIREKMICEMMEEIN
jgi:fumarate reductase subunit D